MTLFYKYKNRLRGNQTMAEASAINQVAALGESVTGLTKVFQQAMGQMTEFVNEW